MSTEQSNGHKKQRSRRTGSEQLHLHSTDNHRGRKHPINSRLSKLQVKPGLQVHQTPTPVRSHKPPVKAVSVSQ